MLSSRSNTSRERSLKNGCWLDGTLLELTRDLAFKWSGGLLLGVIIAHKDDGVTEPLPGYCLPPEIVVLLDVLRLLRLLRREGCKADDVDITALPIKECCFGTHLAIILETINHFTL